MGYFLYILIFIGLYFQVYLLVTFFEFLDEKHKNAKQPYLLQDADLLPATILVPAFNEQDNVVETVQSLLNMDYPKDRLTVFAIDDGSTDNTWNVLQQFKNHPQVQIFHKKNDGGKYTALNYGLERVTTPIVGCLDSDSYVEPNALREVMLTFATTNASVVIPSMLVAKNNTLMRRMQKVEYEAQIYLKKMFDHLRALYIAPGPFSIFRKEVFDKLGPYKEAYHTEDCEIGLRVQANGLRIAHAVNAVVYTHGPAGFGALLRQRLRWFYGGMRNLWDYRRLMFNSKYGDLGMLIMPLSLVSFFALAVVFIAMAVRIVPKIYQHIHLISISGFSTENLFNPPPVLYLIDTRVFSLVAILLLISMISTVVISRHMVKMKQLISLDIIYGLLMYGIVAPIWSVYTIGHLFIPHKKKWKK